MKYVWEVCCCWKADCVRSIADGFETRNRDVVLSCSAVWRVLCIKGGDADFSGFLVPLFAEMPAEGARFLGLLLLLCIGVGHAKGKDLCIKPNNDEYQCETGYCCGEMGCCTNFHELWWFWLVWTVIVMLSCCCAYRHRQVKKRLQQEQRQREIHLMACQGATNTFVPPSPFPPPLDNSFFLNCNLPSYEEIAGRPPTPPPPYSEIAEDTTQTGQNTALDSMLPQSFPSVEMMSSLTCDRYTTQPGQG